MRLSIKQKRIASYLLPKYGGFASDKEIKQAKELAKGKFWLYPDYQDGEPVYEEYVAFSPKGVRKFFEYDLYRPMPPKTLYMLKALMRKAAYYWAKGKKSLSLQIEDDIWDWYHNYTYTVSPQKSRAELKKLQNKYQV